jgi:hypothetical protein
MAVDASEPILKAGLFLTQSADIDERGGDVRFRG